MNQKKIIFDVCVYSVCVCVGGGVLFAGDETQYYETYHTHMHAQRTRTHTHAHIHTHTYTHTYTHTDYTHAHIRAKLQQ